jgi:hypothetical protein
MLSSQFHSEEKVTAVNAYIILGGWCVCLHVKVNKQQQQKKKKKKC